MKYTISKAILLPILFLLLSSLWGCWDNRDVIEMSMVAGVGIDKVDENRIELTIQLINPGILKAIEQGSTADPYWTISTTGDTIFDAIRNMLTTVDKQPFYAHMEIIILGEDIAKDMMDDVLDLFERDHETRKQAYILMAKGISAKEILEAKCPIGSIPALHIFKVIENAKAKSSIKEITLFDFLKDRNSAGKNFVIGTIQPKNSDQKLVKIEDLKVEGVSVFKKDKLVGWFNPMETRGYLFVINEVKGGIITIPNPTNRDKKVSIEIKKVKSKMDVNIINDEPTLLVDIKINGNIGSEQGTGDLTTKNMMEIVKKEIEKVIEEEVKNSIKLAQQEYKSDIFGFGEVVHRKHLDYWNKVKEDWDSEFEKLPVEIKVEAKLIRPGLIKEPSEAK